MQDASGGPNTRPAYQFKYRVQYEKGILYLPGTKAMAHKVCHEVNLRVFYHRFLSLNDQAHRLLSDHTVVKRIPKLKTLIEKLRKGWVPGRLNRSPISSRSSTTADKPLEDVARQESSSLDHYRYRHRFFMGVHSWEEIRG